jgi:putative Mg2+ transporter-C (MgtC) family protein
MAVDWVPIGLAIVVGGVIGAEREIHGRPAGFRTHIMVCLSSMLLIQASQLAPALVPGANAPFNVVLDPNRLASGVVTGIGFLGAAAVIRSGDIVRGITTGACVWAVAVLGVVIGRGAYGLAIAGAGTMVGVLVLFDRALGWATPVVYRRMRVRFEGRGLVELRDELKGVLTARRVAIQDVSALRGADEGPKELELRLRCRNHLQAPELIDLVCDLRGVKDAEWSMLQL